jgi:hypothetical protein
MTASRFSLLSSIIICASASSLTLPTRVLRDKQIDLPDMRVDLLPEQIVDVFEAVESSLRSIVRMPMSRTHAPQMPGMLLTAIEFIHPDEFGFVFCAIIRGRRTQNAPVYW